MSKDEGETSGASYPVIEIVPGQIVTKKAVERHEARAMGNLPPSPFAILSFLALHVITELRLTDLGLVDVNEFRLIN